MARPARWLQQLTCVQAASQRLPRMEMRRERTVRWLTASLPHPRSPRAPVLVATMRNRPRNSGRCDTATERSIRRRARSNAGRTNRAIVNANTPRVSTPVAYPCHLRVCCASAFSGGAVFGRRHPRPTTMASTNLLRVIQQARLAGNIISRDARSTTSSAIIASGAWPRVGAEPAASANCGCRRADPNHPHRPPRTAQSASAAGTIPPPHHRRPRHPRLPYWSSCSRTALGAM